MARRSGDRFSAGEPLFFRMDLRSPEEMTLQIRITTSPEERGSCDDHGCWQPAQWIDDSAEGSCQQFLFQKIKTKERRP